MPEQEVEENSLLVLLMDTLLVVVLVGSRLVVVVGSRLVVAVGNRVQMLVVVVGNWAETSGDHLLLVVSENQRFGVFHKWNRIEHQERGTSHNYNKTPFFNITCCLLLFVVVCCLLLFVVVCCCLLLFVVVCCCLLLFVVVCCCLLLFVVVCCLLRDCLLFFVLFRITFNKKSHWK